ncbi:MAG TPA: type VI secretion system tube protein Hcp [Polyangia bacterium]|nr:type VI secretion system tube protein Hcp [Polyangia bacterium]
MLRRLSCLFVLASLAGACGTEDPGSSGTSTTDPTVNALEASGQVEFFVKIVGANGTPFIGDSTNAQFKGFIDAIRYYSDVNKGSSGATHCTAFRFTKVADRSSPQLVGAVASGETLQSARFDFVHPDGFEWQRLDLTGIRLSMVEQAVAPPDNLSASVVLEEATLVPSGTANVTLTSIPQNPDGSGGAAIVTSFTCKP